ncbi:uncharacterized protein LOC110606238 [Manihot esculenta]|uniref:uncharacterized protein LOC110606238 n=1 Tax=Manihot esculenta TaxID=3983 RepID=UPI001CC7DD6C|nr:uncharacterized protein LOC110606238 [Manihot esculenta]
MPESLPVNPAATENFGDWMLVRRDRRRDNRQSIRPGPKRVDRDEVRRVVADGSTRNRFDSLLNLEDERGSRGGRGLFRGGRGGQAVANNANVEIIPSSATTSREVRPNTRIGLSRKAAAEVEHTVVVGNGKERVESWVVSSEDQVGLSVLNHMPPNPPSFRNPSFPHPSSPNIVPGQKTVNGSEDDVTLIVAKTFFNELNKIIPSSATTSREVRPNTRIGLSRKAAAEVEHTVVVGNGKERVESWVVSSEDQVGLSVLNHMPPNPPGFRNPSFPHPSSPNIVPGQKTVNGSEDDVTLIVAKTFFNELNKEYKRLYHPNIFCLVEPRISGEAADEVCGLLGYENWICVEAVGFSGGIWLLWSEDSFRIELVVTDPQFITVAINFSTGEKWLFSVVYASPDIYLRRKLWQSLSGETSLSISKWIVAGDFNCRSGENVPYQAARLDRCFVSTDWRLDYVDAIIEHPPKLHSDHVPIVIKCQGVLAFGVRPFRSLTARTLHAQFDQVVACSWDPNRSLIHNLSTLKIQLGEWNRTQFGNIFDNKRRLLRRLGGVQRDLAESRSRSLVKLEFKLKRRLEEILRQEEMYWFQKSKEEWIANGERNTHFYHLAATIKRKKFCISALKNDWGEVVTDPSVLKGMAINFFRNLYTSDLGELLDIPFQYAHPVLSTTQIAKLDRPFSPEEVKLALDQMASGKAAGDDGFNVEFYKKAWPIVGTQVIDFVLFCLQGNELPSMINETVLVLIPKVATPEFITQFRSISLCNVLYKLITKVLVNRLQQVLTSLIGPEQNSFVPGRQITDNVVIYQEALHTMGKMNGGNRFMALKINLEKAYDRLEWSFIDWSLEKANFSSLWRTNVRHCVHSASMSVLWNNEKLESFLPTRGIRQGDPLSSYLFVLCVEQLSNIIKHSVKQGAWHPLPISNNGPLVSHLMFADDMVLFAEATEEQLDVIINCLTVFCNASGQKVNFLKSSLFVSPNVSTSTASRLSSKSGIPLVSDLGRYLGVPSLHGRVSQVQFRGLVDDMRSRLAGWKAGALSRAGRITLVQSVLNSIPIYTMQSIKLPVSICKEMERLCRNFIWHGNSGDSAVYLINWQTLQYPKQNGGLGIQNFGLMNQAMLGKLCWRAFMNPSDLWISCLLWKYNNGRISWNLRVPLGASMNWKTLCWGLQLVSSGVSIDVRSEVVVRYYWIPGYGWDWNRLSLWLPDFVLAFLLPICLHDDVNSRDGIIWRHSISGQYSVKTGYSLLVEKCGLPVALPLWKLIWKATGTQRMRVFLWEVAHEKIMVNVQRFRKGWINSNLCMSYGTQSESVLHVLRDCNFFKSCWLNLLPASEVQTFFGFVDIREWLSWCLKSSFVLSFNLGVQKSVPRPLILGKAKEIYQAWNGYFPSSIQRQCRVIRVAWTPAAMGWITINTDGSVRQNSRAATCAGSFRDNYELWAIYHALNVAWSRRWRKIVIQTDSQVAVQLLQEYISP